MKRLIMVALLMAPPAYAGDRLMEINVHDNASGCNFKVGVGDHVILPVGEGYVVEVSKTGTEKIQLLDGNIISMGALAVAHLVADTSRVDLYWEERNEAEADIAAQAYHAREERRHH